MAATETLPRSTSRSAIRRRRSSARRVGEPLMNSRPEYHTAGASVVDCDCSWLTTAATDHYLPASAGGGTRLTASGWINHDRTCSIAERGGGDRVRRGHAVERRRLDAAAAGPRCTPERAADGADALPAEVPLVVAVGTPRPRGARPRARGDQERRVRWDRGDAVAQPQPVVGSGVPRERPGSTDEGQRVGPALRHDARPELADELA